MEKDDEVSGKGNSYTAEFWQYDSRLGRRWNIDPVVKPHRSPYDAFSNNPIIMVDPKGNTDYYNKAGYWVGSDNGEIRLIKAESIIDNNMFMEVYGEDLTVQKEIVETRKTILILSFTKGNKTRIQTNYYESEQAMRYQYKDAIKNKDGFYEIHINEDEEK